MVARRWSPALGVKTTSRVHVAAGASSEPLSHVEEVAADHSLVINPGKDGGQTAAALLPMLVTVIWLMADRPNSTGPASMIGEVSLRAV